MWQSLRGAQASRGETSEKDPKNTKEVLSQRAQGEDTEITGRPMPVSPTSPSAPVLRWPLCGWPSAPQPWGSCSLTPPGTCRRRAAPSSTSFSFHSCHLLARPSLTARLKTAILSPNAPYPPASSSVHPSLLRFSSGNISPSNRRYILLLQTVTIRLTPTEHKLHGIFFFFFEFCLFGSLLNLQQLTQRQSACLAVNVCKYSLCKYFSSK